MIRTLKDLQKLSEEDLSNKIIIPLLKETGCESVTYVCGSDEFGRDIIFFTPSAFNNKLCSAAQVKTVKIHGTSKKDGNIQEVINQIQESFDNSYFDVRSNKKIPVTSMYIITSRSITPKAKRIIETKFIDKPVHFIDGQELVNLIELTHSVTSKKEKNTFSDEDIHKKILESEPEDWVVHEEEGVYTYKKDVNLTIRRTGPDFLEKEFKEPWLKVFPDPNGFKQEYTIFYNNSPIHKEYFVVVDGGRMEVPVPKVISYNGNDFVADPKINKLQISLYNYHLGKIINAIYTGRGHWNYNRYLAMAQIKV